MMLKNRFKVVEGQTPMNTVGGEECDSDEDL